MTNLTKVFNKDSVRKVNEAVLEYAYRLRNGAHFRRNRNLADCLDALALCSAAIAFAYGEREYSTLLNKELSDAFPEFWYEEKDDFSSYYTRLSQSLHKELLSISPCDPPHFHVEINMLILIGNMDAIINRHLNEISQKISLTPV